MDKFASSKIGSAYRVSPLVASITRRMDAMIKANQLRAGEGLPPERQLAAEFAVSRSVVRSAIKKLTEDGLIESKPNCRPVVRNTKAVSKTSRRHLGIWLWPNTADFAAASILKGIQSTDLGEEVRLIIGSALGVDWNSIYESERRFLESLAEDPEQACAIVWYLGGEYNRPSLQKVSDAGVPLVFVDRKPPEGIKGDYVGTNNESGSELAVKHLLSLGHRRIALITNMDVASSVEERESGYRKALRQSSVPADRELIERISVDEPIGIKDAMDRLLKLPSPPTAIFCINDHLAFQVNAELELRGIRVPEEISLVGFDGLLRWVPGGGSLTTVCQDFERIGQYAAELALQRLSNREVDAYSYYFLDAPFFDRGSTGPVNSLSEVKP